MSISQKVENGQPVITIREQPELTEHTLGALIEFIAGVGDKVPQLQQYLSNLEAVAILHGEDRQDWEEEFEVMQFLRSFLTQIRRHQDPKQSL